jgi:hypothetical protein
MWAWFRNFVHGVQAGSGAESPFQWVPGSVKQAFCAARLSSAEVKNVRSYASTIQFIFLTWCLNEAHGYLQKTTKIHNHVSRVAGLPNAKRRSITWLGRLEHSVNHPFTHSLARVETLAGEYVFPSGFGLVPRAACIVVRTVAAIAELVPNQPASKQVAKVELL